LFAGSASGEVTGSKAATLGLPSVVRIQQTRLIAGGVPIDCGAQLQCPVGSGERHGVHLSFSMADFEKDLRNAFSKKI
jgi:hypothetical protein